MQTELRTITTYQRHLHVTTAHYDGAVLDAAAFSSEHVAQSYAGVMRRRFGPYSRVVVRSCERRCEILAGN